MERNTTQNPQWLRQIVQLARKFYYMSLYSIHYSSHPKTLVIKKLAISLCVYLTTLTTNYDYGLKLITEYYTPRSTS